MTKVIFIAHDGATHEVNVAGGLSLMEAAMHNNVPGIEADCGGACACGTCHVYVTPEWQDAVGTPGKTETEMLEFAVNPQPNSRLSCQIRLTPALDGVTVKLPVSQH